jgi:transposase InsO family protein
MFKKSTLDKNITINDTNTRVQTAKNGTNIIPIGRANIGSTYKNSLIFNDEDLSENLISIPRLDDDGCKITIQNGKMIVTKNDETIMEATKLNGLYEFDLNGTENALMANVQPQDRASALRRMHHVFGHRNLIRINKYIKAKTLINKEFPNNVSENEIKSMPICDACARAKFTKRRIHRIDKRGVANLGERLSTDIKGPIRIKGINGERYYQGFLDEHSKYIIHKCFSFKSEAPKNLAAILEESPFRGNAKRYLADGAGELISKETAIILKDKGIIMNYSSPYTSTDNAAIERSHRTIFESAHAMMIHACISIMYWPYAVAHAVYIYNRVPTNTAMGYISPLRAAFNYDKDLSDEPTFGCNCYGIIPAATRLKGFTEKGFKGIYMGHRLNGSPGYIILSVDDNKIKECSDVTFDESDLDSGERSKRQRPEGELEVAPVSREMKDFEWLCGMAYKDENILYITTRINIQQHLIVAYRAPVYDSVVGTEEDRPIHVADVEALVNAYLLLNKPMINIEGKTLTSIGLDGEDNSADATPADPGGIHITDPSDVDRGLTEGTKGREPGADAPTRVVRQLTAAIEQNPSTDQHIEYGETQAVGDSIASKRSRITRVPLNIGVMGNIERVFSIQEFNTEYIYHLSDNDIEPNPNMLLYDDILGAADKDLWLAAGKDEIMSIVWDNNTWEPAELPKHSKALTTKWLFKRKGKRYKARLCARGFQQRENIDYFETYAPTAKWVTLRLFLTICACMGLLTSQLDVKTAFLYAELEEDIYITCPRGINEHNNPFGLPPEVLKRCKGKVFKLMKSLYGLKQAPRNWYETLRTFLTNYGFTPVKSDSCIFVTYIEDRVMMAIVFVDDILIGAASKTDLEELVKAFKCRFKITDTGEVDVYLSIKVERNWATHSMMLNQKDYIMQMWKTFNGVENLRVKTPFVEGWRINNATELVES